MHSAKAEKVWDELVTLDATSRPRLGSDSAKDGNERKGKRELQECNNTSLYYFFLEKCLGLLPRLAVFSGVPPLFSSQHRALHQ